MSTRLHPLNDDGIQLPIESYESVVTYMGQHSSRNCYHAYHKTESGDPVPACGTPPRNGTPVVWSLEQAIAWRDPCQRCFDMEGDR